LWPLWLAGFVSAAGDSMHQVAIMWLIYELTGSKAATGLIGMSQYLPAVVIGVFAGALVDRFNRRRMMILSDGVRVILVAAIPTLYLLGLMTGWLLGILAFSVAVFTTLFYPARESIIPQIVESHELTRAGSFLQASYGFAFLIGPVIAAALLPFAKITGLFYADALTFAVSLAFLLKLRPRPALAPSAESSTTFRAVRDGLRYANSHGLIRGLLLVTAVDNLFIMGPALVGTPLYVRLYLGLGASAFAAAGASEAAGMILGSFLVHRVAARFPRGRILLWAIIWDGISFVPFMFIHSLYPTLAMWFIHSIGIPFIIVPRSTLIQTEVPAQFQGRIFSLVNLTVVGLSAISCAITGVVAEILPVNILYAVIGLAATVVGAAGWLVRDLRKVA
jgi:MFS transporter, DHA3 family, macrolide efflux protein